MDLFELAVLKNMSGGGSGGGGVSSWNDLTDRPFYAEDGGIAVLLEETTLESEDTGEFGLSTVLPIVEGETYTVNWNGVEYTCVARTETMDGITATGFGNIDAMMQTGDTGEPFIVMNAPIAPVTMIMSFEGLDTVTISISGKAPETIHKLDNKFIDAEWMATKKFVREKELLTEQPVANNGSIQEVLPGETLRAETEVIVVYDGTAYTCAVQTEGSGDDGTWHCVGNGDILTQGGLDLGFTGNGEPFAVAGMSYNGGTNVVFYADSGTHTLEIFVGGVEREKLPEEYAPIFTSPNGTKWVLSVADDGTVSATTV